MVSVSASDVLFPVQDEDEKQTMPTKIASTTNITAFLILQLIHLLGSIKPSNFWQKYNFISINFFISLKNITFAMFFYKLVNKLYNYNMLEKIEELLKEVNNLTASNAEEIEQLRLKYLSKKGEITALMADFRNVPADQKKVVGMKINELKQAALQKINDLKEQNAEAEESADDIDLTRSAYPISLGRWMCANAEGCSL